MNAAMIFFCYFTPIFFQHGIEITCTWASDQRNRNDKPYFFRPRTHCTGIQHHVYLQEKSQNHEHDEILCLIGRLIVFDGVPLSFVLDNLEEEEEEEDHIGACLPHAFDLRVVQSFFEYFEKFRHSLAGAHSATVFEAW